MPTSSVERVEERVPPRERWLVREVVDDDEDVEHLAQLLLLGRGNHLLLGGYQRLQCQGVVVVPGPLLLLRDLELVRDELLYGQPGRVRMHRRREHVDALKNGLAVVLLVEVGDHRDDEHGLAAARRPGDDGAEGHRGQVLVPALVGVILRHFWGDHFRHLIYVNEQHR